MFKETGGLYSVYCLLFIITVARVREILNYELLRHNAELHSAIRNYGEQLGGEMAHRASSTFRRFCANERDCELVAPFKRYYPQYTIPFRNTGIVAGHYIIGKQTEKPRAILKKNDLKTIAGSPRRISSCMIPKNMSTVLSAIFCLLFTGELGKTNRTVTTMLKRKCESRNELHSFAQIEKLSHGGKWTNFAMVRNPAERFLSGFMFMCTPNNMVRNNCEGCIGDVRCALRQTFEQSQRFASGDLSAATFLLWHLGPQNWHCDLQRNAEKFKLLKYSPNNLEKLTADLRYVLKEGGVETSDVDLIVAQVANGTTLHATNRLVRKKFYEMQMDDPEVQELLVKTFYWDYVLFNYPLPRLSRDSHFKSF